MPDRDTTKQRSEIAHVLFIDIVGYSKLLTNEQKARLETLKNIVRGTEQYQRAKAEEKLLGLPTGDGGALVFRNDHEAPALCAMEISRELRNHPQLQVRMGIHSGPVNEISDLNQQANVAGAGINIAQRVMDCGDAGHILISKHVAEDLEQDEDWRPLLHELGPCEVKHGVRVDISNLYSDEVGNRKLPGKLQAVRKHRTHVRWAEVAAALLLLGAIVGAGFFYLRRPAGQLASAVAADSIAVLPFVNMSDEKANEYFSDGISEELLNLLAKVPQLKVAARTSSFSFKGKGVEIPEIARQLRVANVLEGSVRKSGDQLRITAQLVRAAEGYHLWSETYDRKMDDIFKIQDEIAGEVVKELKVKLLGAAPKVRTTDPKAYALYLQAVELGRQFNAEAFAESDALYRQVLEIDPHYAPAWTNLAANLLNKTNTGLLPNHEGFTRTREAAEKALTIDPDYALTHVVLALIARSADSDLAGAAQHFERAIAIDPTNLVVLGNAVTLLGSLGRLDEALALEEAVVRRDPINLTRLYSFGVYQRYAARYDASIASFKTALSLSPTLGDAHCQLGIALMLKGETGAALAEIKEEQSEESRLIGLPMAYCALGRKADADAALNAVIAKYEKEAPSNIAYVYAFCGNADKAFEWLDKAVTYQDPGLSGIVVENLFDNAPVSIAACSASIKLLSFWNPLRRRSALRKLC